MMFLYNMDILYNDLIYIKLSMNTCNLICRLIYYNKLWYILLFDKVIRNYFAE